VLFFYPGIFFFSFFVDGNLVKCNDFVAFVLFFSRGWQSPGSMSCTCIGIFVLTPRGALCIEPLVLCPLNKSL
jgi:hypothetical protein